MCKTCHLSACFRMICLMACTSPLKGVRQTQHILQQRRQNILKITKSCLDEVFKILETSSQTSSQNSLSELVRLLQSQVLAERHSATRLRLEVLSLRKIAQNTNENLIAKQLHLEAMTDMLGRSHSLAQQLAQ